MLMDKSLSHKITLTNLKSGSVFYSYYFQNKIRIDYKRIKLF